MAPSRDDAGLSLRVDSVRFAFGTDDRVLDGLSMEVPAGTVLSLLGPSGCGKTTLLRVVAGLDPPESGSVWIGERQLSGEGIYVPPEKRAVGMVFQDWALFPHLDVASNIAFGLPRERRRDPSAIDATLELVDLDGLGSRMPSQLSGGQQQRVALGRALAQEPAVLLLDEPFSNLDATLRARVRSDVHRLLERIGVTTVMVTHDRDEAFVLGDSVALMRNGGIVQQGTPAEVYRNPTDAWCARFVGEANLLPGRASGRSAETVLGPLSLGADHHGAVDVLLRPEDLELLPCPTTPATPASKAGGTIGVVSVVEYHGPRTHYLVEVSGETLRVESAGLPEASEGESVWVAAADHPFPAFDR